MASAKGTLDCVSAWLTDFRLSIKKIAVPTLVVHGDADRIRPFGVTGKRTHEVIPGSRLVVVEGGPHGLNWTHAGELNWALPDFQKRCRRRRSLQERKHHRKKCTNLF